MSTYLACRILIGAYCILHIVHLLRYVNVFSMSYLDWRILYLAYRTPVYEFVCHIVNLAQLTLHDMRGIVYVTKSKGYNVRRTIYVLHAMTYDVRRTSRNVRHIMYAA